MTVKRKGVRKARGRNQQTRRGNQKGSKNETREGLFSERVRQSAMMVVLRVLLDLLETGLSVADVHVNLLGICLLRVIMELYEITPLLAEPTFLDGHNQSLPSGRGVCFHVLFVTPAPNSCFQYLLVKTAHCLGRSVHERRIVWFIVERQNYALFSCTRKGLCALRATP